VDTTIMFEKDRDWNDNAPQTITKPRLDAKKKMVLCVWGDRKRIVHYELLPLGKTIDSDLYCQQLMRFKQWIQEKWPELINRKRCVWSTLS